MRQVPANVQELIEPAVVALGYELVGIEYMPQGKHSLLRVYIDADDGINLDDCTRVSHQVSGLLDVEDVLKGQYSLEISSPGLDRPLFTLEQFARFTGHAAKVHMVAPKEGQRKFRGVIISADNDNVVIDVDGKQIELAFSLIDRANLVPDITKK